jgi:hypothetical protein
VQAFPRLDLPHRSPHIDAPLACTTVNRQPAPPTVKTVLLTAKYATDKGLKYITLSPSSQATEEHSSPAAHCQCYLQKLDKRLRWLNMLDLESVPSQANLLATVLIRIRDALDEEYPETRSRGLGVPSSILEEGLEKPWKRLDTLIRNATFMWEDKFGSNDPRRERSQQQITAAEQLARFQADINLELRDPANSSKCVPLPPGVAGWFMILHDLLTFNERVSNSDSNRITPQDMMPKLVVMRHELLCKGEIVPLEFAWNLPSWDLFLDFFVFAAQWRAFLQGLKPLLRPDRQTDKEKSPGEQETREWERESSVFARAILAAWIDNACWVALDKRGHWSWAREAPGEAFNLVTILKSQNVTALEQYEDRVRCGILALRKQLRSLRLARFGRKARALAWLEIALPLLFKPEHAPFDIGLFEPFKKQSKIASDMQPEENEAWENLRRSWYRREDKFSAIRSTLVRRAARKSERFSELSEPDKADGGPVAQEWLTSVVDAWFRAPEPPGAGPGAPGPGEPPGPEGQEGDWEAVIIEETYSS